MVKNRTYGSALNEIAALQRRNAELEKDKRDLLHVLDEVRDVFRDLNAKFDGSQAVGR